MRKTEAIFLGCVLAVGGLVAGRSVLEAVPAIVSRAEPGAAPGAAGQARDVDMAEILRQLEQGMLSDHEAEFYEPAEGAAAPPAAEGSEEP